MTISEHLEQCFTCARRFRYGPNEYQGHYLARWQMIVCDGCRPNVWSEVPPIYQSRVVSHLTIIKIKPRVNAKGFLEWPTS